MSDDNKMPSQAPITLKEAAEVILRGLVTPRTMRACIDRGDLKAYKIGRRIVTTPEDLQEWMHQRQYEPPPQFRLRRQPTQKYKPQSDEVERVRKLLLDIKAERLAQQKVERENRRRGNVPQDKSQI